MMIKRLIPIGVAVLAVLMPLVGSARDIMAAGKATVWRYLDNGQAPSADWQGVGFDDSQWKSGPAPLGYGRAGLGTEVETGVGHGTNAGQKYITTWFRHAFVAPALKPGERLVVSFCVADGAAIYLNGHEVGGANLPDGALKPDVTAPHSAEGNELYLRVPVPVEALLPGTNVFAVEVHQSAPASRDIVLDLALKTLPPVTPTPPVPAAAMAAVTAFLRQDYVGPEMSIPDGYEDGGHAMKLKGQGPPLSGREILVVDRTNDVELAQDLAFARSPELRALPPVERSRRIGAHIDEEMTPPGGMHYCDRTCAELQAEFKNQPVYLGEWVAQAHTGVCRHRALLFKVLAEEAGLKVALVRGHLVLPVIPEGGQHDWNELFLDNGQRLLVDVTNMRSKANYQEVTKPVVYEHYRKHDNTAWYEAGKGE